MGIEVSFLLPDLTDEQRNVLQGETPFDTIVEKLVEQFDSYKETSHLIGDKTDYIDVFQTQLDRTKQVHQQAFEEYELDDSVLRQMTESLSDILLYCMGQIGCDTYQLEDPFKSAYQLYTNFMLTDQRQPFFEYTLDRIINRIDPSSLLFRAYERMYHGDPKPMYDLLNEIDLAQDDSITHYMEASGNDYTGKMIQEGYIPENIMLDLFLKPLSIPQAYSTYYMHKVSAHPQ